MIKRLLSLIAAIALAMAVLTLPAFAGSVTTGVSPATYAQSQSSNVTMYVYTENGKGLNVRSAPYVGENIIAVAPYGSSLQVLRFLDNGWTCILWPRYGEAYVQSRFLQWYAPGPYVTAAPTATPSPAPTSVPYVQPTAYTDTLAVLNAEFRTARLVTPFTVTVRPARASGWVNMRWAPSKDTEVLATYRSGAQLTVIAETQSWYQVADPSTEATGFIMKTYVVRQN